MILKSVTAPWTDVLDGEVRGTSAAAFIEAVPDRCLCLLPGGETNLLISRVDKGVVTSSSGDSRFRQ